MPIRDTNLLPSFQAGQQQGAQNALVERELMRDQQTSNLLADYTMAGATPEARQEALNRLLAHDPGAAQSVMQTRRAQQQVSAEQEAMLRQRAIEEATAGLGMARFVRERSSDPVRALELLDDDEAVRTQMREQGLDPENPADVMQAMEMLEGRFAMIAGPGEAPESPFSDIDPSEYTPESIAEFQRTNDYSALRPVEPADAAEPTALEAKMATVTEALGRPLTEAEVLDAAGISAGDAEDVRNEQIPPTQLPKVRLPDGSTPEVGTTWGEAMEAGAKVMSAADIKRQESIEGALNTLDELERMALDPDTGVFVDEGGSFVTNNFLGRLVSGINNGFGALVGTESSERRAIFDATSRGVLSSLVRSLGESGALSDGDVQRAMELIPTLGAMPDTERKAKAQFSELRTILTRGQENLQGMEGSEAVTDLGAGWSVRQVR